MKSTITIHAEGENRAVLEAALARRGDVPAFVFVRGGMAADIAIVSRAENAPPGLSPRDILVTPFRLGAFLDRLSLVSRSTAGEDFSFGSFYLRWEEMVLLDGAQGRIALTEKERALLWALHAAGSAGMARLALLQAVWGYGAGIETHTLETHVYRLRQKIECDPADPQILLTHESGYSLIR